MIPDNYTFFCINDEEIRAEREEIKKRLPRCAWCGQAIWDDECYDIEGEIVCPDCLNKRKVWTQNLMKE